MLYTYGVVKACTAGWMELALIVDTSIDAFSCRSQTRSTFHPQSCVYSGRSNQIHDSCSDDCNGSVTPLL